MLQVYILSLNVIIYVEREDIVSFVSFYVRVSTTTAIRTVGHGTDEGPHRTTQTNGHMFTALALDLP